MPGKSRWFNTTFDSVWTQFGNRLYYTLWLWEVCLNFSITVIQLLGFKVRLFWSNMSQVVCCECVCETRCERHAESYTSHTCVLSLTISPPSSLPYQGIFCARFHQQVLLWIKHRASSSRNQPCAQVDILSWSLRTACEFMCVSERKQKWERNRESSWIYVCVHMFVAVLLDCTFGQGTFWPCATEDKQKPSARCPSLHTVISMLCDRPLKQKSPPPATQTNIVVLQKTTNYKKEANCLCIRSHVLHKQYYKND